MHDDLTMAKKYAFGIAGCTAGIEGCGNGVFIKIFKLVLIAGLCEHGFVFALGVWGHWRVVIIQPNHMLDRWRILGMAFDHR